MGNQICVEGEGARCEIAKAKGSLTTPQWAPYHALEGRGHGFLLAAYGRSTLWLRARCLLWGWVVFMMYGPGSCGALFDDEEDGRRPLVARVVRVDRGR
jgi:hypothetical protein